MRSDTAAAILAGGAGARIGGRKAFVKLAERTLVERVADALRPSVRMLAVVGEEDAARLVGGVALIDRAEQRAGPLYGVLAALDWGRDVGVDWVVIAPCDAPFLPTDVLKTLREAAEVSGVAYAETQGGPHPLVSIWRSSMAGWLRDQMDDGHPPVRDVLASANAARVMFEDEEAFMNINTSDDLKRAEAILATRR